MMRKVVVTLEYDPRWWQINRIEDAIRGALYGPVIYDPERIVSIEVEPHPDDDFGSE
jgi:hypothetical protein